MSPGEMLFIGTIASQSNISGVPIRCLIAIDEETGNWSMDFSLPTSGTTLRFLISSESVQATIWEIVLNSLREHDPAPKKEH